MKQDFDLANQYAATHCYISEFNEHVCVLYCYFTYKCHDDPGMISSCLYTDVHADNSWFMVLESKHVVLQIKYEFCILLVGSGCVCDGIYIHMNPNTLYSPMYSISTDLDTVVC